MHSIAVFQHAAGENDKHCFCVAITYRYVFDNLSCDQAEDMLRRHGDDGSYLVSHFHDPESYALSIRLSLVRREGGKREGKKEERREGGKRKLGKEKGGGREKREEMWKTEG